MVHPGTPASERTPAGTRRPWLVSPGPATFRMTRQGAAKVQLPKHIEPRPQLFFRAAVSKNRDLKSMPRPRKPNHLHVVSGTYRKGRHAAAESVQALPALPDELKPPTWLTRGAKRVFRQTVETLAPLGILAKVDRDVLAHYASLQAQLESAPASFTASLHAQLRALRGELGMSPATRHKTAPRGSSNGPNPFEGIV